MISVKKNYFWKIAFLNKQIFNSVSLLFFNPRSIFLFFFFSQFVVLFNLFKAFKTSRKSCCSLQGKICMQLNPRASIWDFTLLIGYHLSCFFRHDSSINTTFALIKTINKLIMAELSKIQIWHVIFFFFFFKAIIFLFFCNFYGNCSH